jgi:preprotein translocase subunit SecA
VTKSVQQAQEQVESQNFEMRKNVLKYDDVMNRQRHAIYGDRRRVLEGADVEPQLRRTVDTVVEQYVRSLTADGFVEDWDFETIWTQLRTLYPVKLDINDYVDNVDLTADELVADFQADAQAAYDARTEELGEELMREFERQVLLTVLDRKWREHLYEMDYLREGIGLRAMAQRDPLVEYQREGGDMFNAMMEAFMEEVVGYLFNLEVRVEQPAPQVGLVTSGDGEAVTAESLLSDAREAAPVAETSVTKRPALKAKGLQRSAAATPLAYSAPDESGEVTRKGEAASDDPYAGVGRNAPCPCGSGKKFKVCHGRS